MVFTQLKICGITSEHDAQIAAEIGVAFLGFNFFPRSKRYIEPARAKQIIQSLAPTVQCVGIVVRPTLHQCRQILEETGVRWLQIYEPQDFDDFNRLPVPVIAAYRLQEKSPFEYTNQGEQFVLIDSYGTRDFGGTGRPLNWDNVPTSLPPKKLVLAGGITPHNITAALNKVNPAIIDVASGSELSPGKKDVRKILALQRAVLRFNLNRLTLKNIGSNISLTTE